MDIFLAMFKETFSNYYFSIFIHILIFIYVVLIVSKVIFKKMLENFVYSDQEIFVIGFYENDEGIKYKPFDFSLSVNKDEVKKISFKDGVISILDANINSTMSIEESLKNLEKNLYY